MDRREFLRISGALVVGAALPAVALRGQEIIDVPLIRDDPYALSAPRYCYVTIRNFGVRVKVG